MLFEKSLLNFLQGTMTTIDPRSVKKENIDEYMMLKILERLDHIEEQIDDLIFSLKIEFKGKGKDER